MSATETVIVSPERDKEHVIAELENIRQQSGDGMLKPLDVVNRARDPENILHSRFEWDDTKASEAFRLWQARQLIVTFQVIIPEQQKTTQMYYSLTSDRNARAGGGYRPIMEILSDDEKRSQLLEDAFHELEYFQKKYSQLAELEPLFKITAKLRKTYHSK